MSKKNKVCKNFTYYSIIKEAILNERGQKATSTQIFTYITNKHPQLFRQSNSMTWKGNIRQLLSKNPEFVKLQKDEATKLHYWKYVPLDEIIENEQENLYKNNEAFGTYCNYYDPSSYRYPLRNNMYNLFDSFNNYNNMIYHQENIYNGQHTSYNNYAHNFNMSNINFKGQVTDIDTYYNCQRKSKIKRSVNTKIFNHGNSYSELFEEYSSEKIYKSKDGNIFHNKSKIDFLCKESLLREYKNDCEKIQDCTKILNFLDNCELPDNIIEKQTNVIEFQIDNKSIIEEFISSIEKQKHVIEPQTDIVKKQSSYVEEHSNSKSNIEEHVNNKSNVKEQKHVIEPQTDIVKEQVSNVEEQKNKIQNQVNITDFQKDDKQNLKKSIDKEPLSNNKNYSDTDSLQQECKQVTKNNKKEGSKNKKQRKNRKNIY